MSSPAFQIRVPRPAARRGRRRARPADRRAPAPGRGAARVPFVTLVALVLLGGVVGLLLFNTSMQQASFAATALQDQADALTARRADAAAWSSTPLRDPQRVAAQAQRMGMVTAGDPGLPRPARPASVLGSPAAGHPPRRACASTPCRASPAVARPAPPRDGAGTRPTARPNVDATRARPRPPGPPGTVARWIAPAPADAAVPQDQQLTARRTVVATTRRPQPPGRPAAAPPAAAAGAGSAAAAPARRASS